MGYAYMGDVMGLGAKAKKKPYVPPPVIEGSGGVLDRGVKASKDAKVEWNTYIKALRGLLAGIRHGKLDPYAIAPNPPDMAGAVAAVKEANSLLTAIEGARKSALYKSGGINPGTPQAAPPAVTVGPDTPADTTGGGTTTTGGGTTNTGGGGGGGGGSSGVPYVDPSTGQLVWPGAGGSTDSGGGAAPGSSSDAGGGGQPYYDPNTGQMVYPGAPAAASSAGTTFGMPTWLVALGIGVGIYMTLRRKGA